MSDWRDQFVGRRLLSGVWHCVTANGFDDSDSRPPQAVQVLLDGQLWQWTEDPNDGYRSYMMAPTTCPEMPCSIWPESEWVIGYLVEVWPDSFEKVDPADVVNPMSKVNNDMRIDNIDTHISVYEARDVSYSVCHLLMFVSEETGKRVLTIGTLDANDYYPCAISHFHPENMGINQGRAIAGEIDMTGKGEHI